MLCTLHCQDHHRDLQTLVLLMVLAMTSTGCVNAIDAQFKELRDILLPPARGFADFDKHVKTLSEAVGMVTSRIASVEQTVNALSAKMESRTHAASASNVSGSARSWSSVEQIDGSTGRPLPRLTVFSPPGGSRRIFLRFSHSMGSTLLCHIWSAVLLFVKYHLAPEKVPLVIVVAHAIASLAFFLLRYGFIAVKLQWCRKLRW